MKSVKCRLIIFARFCKGERQLFITHASSTIETIEEIKNGIIKSRDISYSSGKRAIGEPCHETILEHIYYFDGGLYYGINSQKFYFESKIMPSTKFYFGKKIDRKHLKNTIDI